MNNKSKHPVSHDIHNQLRHCVFVRKTRANPENTGPYQPKGLKIQIKNIQGANMERSKRISHENKARLRIRSSRNQTTKCTHRKFPGNLSDASKEQSKHHPNANP